MFAGTSARLGRNLRSTLQSVARWGRGGIRTCGGRKVVGLTWRIHACSIAVLGFMLTATWWGLGILQTNAGMRLRTIGSGTVARRLEEAAIGQVLIRVGNARRSAHFNSGIFIGPLLSRGRRYCRGRRMPEPKRAIK